MATEQTIFDVSNQAGEFDIEYFEILLADGDGLGVSDQIDSISIYEDMFSQFITGSVTFRDTLDIPNYIGRGGKDLLNISIKTKGLPDTETSKIQGLFYIYKFSDRVMVGHRMQKYTFHFVSIEMMFDFKRQVSTAFRGTGDEIIEGIIKKYYPETKKAFIADKSSNPIKFVSNFWTPSKCIQYATEFSATPVGDASYSFFENRDGFNFKTLDTLFNIDKEKPFQVFAENDFSADVITSGQLAGTASRNPNKDAQVVQAVRIDTVYDFIDTYNAGAISSRLTTYDLLKKTISARTITARSKSRINENPLFAASLVESVDPIRMYMPKHYDVHNLGNVTNSKFLQSRISDLRILNSSKIEIDVFGKTDYTVGKVIYYSSTTKTSITYQDDPENIVDVMYSGYYLITAIHHQFTRKSHMCTIELSREGSLTK